MGSETEDQIGEAGENSPMPGQLDPQMLDPQRKRFSRRMAAIHGIELSEGELITDSTMRLLDYLITRKSFTTKYFKAAEVFKWLHDRTDCVFVKQFDRNIRVKWMELGKQDLIGKSFHILIIR